MTGIERKNYKKVIIVMLFLFVTGIVFSFNVNFAYAAEPEFVPKVLSKIALGLANLTGKILTATMDIVYTLFDEQAKIKQYVDTTEGWRHVRDLCNMFFVLGLLIIAFATILRYENYTLKKALPKLIIMAVLINFSKTICLLLVDFSNVVMMEFSNVLVSSRGSFVDALGLQHLMQINAVGELGYWPIFNALMLSLAILVLTLIVMIMFVVMLAGRLVMLIILTILSPIGFLASAIPGGNKYFGQWWGEFTKYLIVGPVLAFFTWLALTISSGAGSLFGRLNEAIQNQTDVTDLLNEIASPENLMRYVIGIGLLIGALKITQQLGGIGSSVGNNMAMNIKNRGTRLAKRAAMAPVKGGKTLGLWGARHADNLQMKAQSKLGVEQPKSLNYRMIAEGYKRQRADSMRKYEAGKSGGWEGAFTRFYQPSMRVPVIGKNIRKMTNKGKKEVNRIETNIQEAKTGISKQQEIIDTHKDKKVELEQNLKNAKTPKEKQEINQQLEELNNNFESAPNKIKRFNDEIKELQKSLNWVGGRPPRTKQVDLEKKRMIKEAYSECSKEDLDEDGLVHAYINETNTEKKRAYLQHIADINGMNTLFGSLKRDMDYDGVKDFYKEEFGDDAADVASDIGKRAEGAGNLKMLGYTQFNSATGKDEFVTKHEQINNALAKSREKFTQSYARTTHMDTLVDQKKDGGRVLSDQGVQELLQLARSKNRMAEIDKGNYQDRFAKTILDQWQNGEIQSRMDSFKEKGDTKSAEDLESVYKAFNGKYGSGKKEQEQEESVILDDTGKPYKK